MRILVAEDEEPVWRFLKEALMGEYFAVDVALDGEAAVHLARINEYDLILLDTTLPKKTGIEVCRELRAYGRTVPILVISEQEELEAKVALLNAGADDYMTKPIVLEELCARARALLRRPLLIADDILFVEDIELNIMHGTVRRAGKELRLTRKEFMLLRYLMRNEGMVLSRGMILEHVWDMSVDIFSNTIESHILSLRKKLGDTGVDRLIRTVPGRGYRISV